ncbi:MAG: type II toxin-antitoxin system death-on-curing family toxin [Chloroflexi bacterium]|uniref:type II toxin-antitoxin system death-on-curing family toxin n=1 Tax=Candidatus Flexifilum breve TaxID=3140694 RepID=UPI0031369C20|nr:type II toxin-antitoxin system death-on-curing family toxin [Chloroflexota bacterium]
MRYLSLSELIYINGTILKNPQITSGKRHVRDIDLLQAAVLRPAASAFGKDAYPTLREKTAALLHSIARNHPFTDGNKRTATVGAVFMLAVNGERVVWEPTAALTTILQIAEGELDVPEIAEWLPLEAQSPTLLPDADADMRHIARIIEEQRWLLNELERR